MSQGQEQRRKQNPNQLRFKETLYETRTRPDIDLVVWWGYPPSQSVRLPNNYDYEYKSMNTCKTLKLDKNDHINKEKGP